MSDFKDEIDTELEYLAMQAGTGLLPKIKKLSPAQMAALATTLGRKHGVKVEFRNFSTAVTDGSTITLPLTGRENSWIVRGYLDHELSHIRLTDFNCMPGQHPFKKTLWNLFEDIRIEGLMPLTYPGMASNYRALVSELRKTTPGLFEVDESSRPEAVIAAYISLMLRSLYLKQVELADLAIRSRRVFINVFGNALEQDLFQAMMEIRDAVTPEAVVELVEKILEILKRHSADNPPALDGTEDSGGDRDAPASSKGCGNTDSKQPDNDKQAGNPSNPDQEADDAGLGSCQGAGDMEDEKKGPSPSTAITQALNSQSEIEDLGQQLKELVQTRERSTACQTYEIASPANKADLIATGYQKQPIAAHSGLVAQLSSRLRGLLQAQDLEHAKPGMTGNRIARNRLHRIKTGDPRLFLRKTPKKAVNTAIHLLLDNSTSMDENQRFHITKEVTLALIKSLENMRGINPAVTLFPAFYPYNRRNNGTAAPVARLLSHGEKPGRNMLYPGGPKGQTPLHAAVRFVASEMLGLSEPRKILVILTDGEPDCTEDAEMAIQEAGDLGIQVVCLGIEELVETKIFPHFEIVQSVRDLPEKTFSLLERLLTRQ